MYGEHTLWLISHCIALGSDRPLADILYEHTKFYACKMAESSVIHGLIIIAAVC